MSEVKVRKGETLDSALRRFKRSCQKAGVLSEVGKLALTVIRMARAHIRQAEIDNGHVELTDDQVIAVLRKEVKQRKETLAELADSSRDDLIEQTNAEIAVLQKYLPAELSEEEIRKVVQEIVDAMDPEQRNMGSMMKAAMAQLKGKADGKVISAIVRELLA